MKTDCLIIGGGPAGYTAAIYAVRAGLNAVLYEGMLPGGQLTTTTLVSNFPGFKDGIDANELMPAIREQAVNLGADIRRGTIMSLDASRRPFKAVLDSGETLEAESVIVATGASAKYLGLPSEQRFKGLGVSACATCDGFFYRKKVVAVVGGGDTACEEASYLASLCRKVYMIVRRNVLRATDAMQKRVLTNPNIEILWECNTREVLGDDSGVTGVRLERSNGEIFDIAVDGFFLAIGHHPNSDVFKGILELDDNGYIVTEGKSTRTSVDGIFAAGDVQDPSYRQAVVAAASGAKAAMDVKAYLSKILLAVILFVGFSMTSCRSEFEALLASNDVDAKYSAAFDFFETKKYKKAASLFESLSMLTSGLPQDDTVRFYWALSNYRFKDYVTAEANFNSFVEVFPRSPFTPDARFLKLDCMYRNTYRYELDQNPTRLAIVQISEFILECPESDKIPICKKMLDELNVRLETKEFEAAKLYYMMEDYIASKKALKNVLKENSKNMYREQIMYYLAMSAYKYANLSVAQKQKERFMEFEDEYFNFIGEYPESVYRRELDRLHGRVRNFIDNGGVIDRKELRRQRKEDRILQKEAEKVMKEKK